MRKKDYSANEEHQHEALPNKATPYELGKDLFGQDDLGQQDLSITYKARLKALLQDKHKRAERRTDGR